MSASLTMSEALLTARALANNVFDISIWFANIKVFMHNINTAFRDADKAAVIALSYHLRKHKKCSYALTYKHSKTPKFLPFLHF